MASNFSVSKNPSGKLQNIFILSLFLMSGFLFANKAEAATYFVDNTLVTGANDGSNWPNAFRSVTNLVNYLIATGRYNYDTIYIKATGSPYYEFLGAGWASYKTIYGDAVGGSGTETTRGTAKAEFRGYVDTSAYTWVQEGSSNTYTYTNSTLSNPFSNSMGNLDAFYANSFPGTADITYNNCATPTDIPLNTVCYQYPSLHINIGTNPNGKNIKVKIDHPLEIWEEERLYGVKGSYGTYGISNSGCSTWIIEGIELSNNGVGSAVNASDLNTHSYFRNSFIHDNTAGGVKIMAAYMRNVHYQNNLIYNNTGAGMYFRGMFNASDPGGYIENNTIYGNTSYGIYIDGMMSDPDPNIWTIKNNIVFGNTGTQLYLKSGYTYTLTASTNVVGATNNYGGIWATYDGGSATTTDIKLDPLMVSPASPTFDFKLQSGSPAKDAGVTISSITTDYLGTAIPRGAAPDIGAYEYDATAPTLSGASTIGLTSDSTPDFTFATDEAGTILYAGDCSSSNSTAAVGSNTVTFSTLSDGTHSNCQISVIDPAGNDSATTSISSFIVDIPSVLTETTAIATPTNDTTPSYVFSATKAGTLLYAGSCTPSSSTSISSGSNTVTFNTLSDGTYTNCKLSVITTLGIDSATTTLSSFTIDTTPPTLTETTPIATPSTDTTPSYVFSSNEAGTLLYAGSCTPSSSTSISSGSNTVTFNALSDNTYTNCKLSVIDSAGNDSSTTTLASFIIDTTNPSSFITSSPLSGAVASTKPPFSWVASSDSGSGLAKYTLYIDSTIDTDGIGNTTTSISPNNVLSCGTHTWYIKATDNTGNVTNSNTSSFNVGCAGGSFGGSGGGGGSLNSTIPTPRYQIVYPDGRVVYLDTPNSVTTITTTNTSGAVPTALQNPSATPSSTLNFPLSTFNFSKPLPVGTQSSDVKALQTFLASDKTLYPEGLVTGYFGPLTKSAVLQFQLKYKVILSAKDPGAGNFGPKTRGKVNEMMKGIER